MPFFHASGLITYTGALFLGRLIRVFWKFDEHLFLKSVQDYKLSMIAVVPTLLVFLAKSPLVEQYDVSSLKELMVGAAPVSKETETVIMET